MTEIQFSQARVLWLSRFILPHEPALRSQLARWHIPGDLEIDYVVQCRRFN